MNQKSKMQNTKRPITLEIDWNFTLVLLQFLHHFSCYASLRTSGSSKTLDPSTTVINQIIKMKNQNQREKNDEYITYPFGWSVTMPLWLLDAILVSFVRLVVSGVILRLRHFSQFSRCSQWALGFSFSSAEYIFVLGTCSSTLTYTLAFDASNIISAV